MLRAGLFVVTGFLVFVVCITFQCFEYTSIIDISQSWSVSWHHAHQSQRVFPHSEPSHILPSNEDDDDDGRGKSQIGSAKRNLQASRQCNTDLPTKVRTTDIQTIFDFLLDQMVPLDEAVMARPSITPVLQYEVAVAKVCLRCSDMGFQDLPTKALLNTSQYGFQSYCAVDKYGWDATHSALIFYPIDDSNGQILTGQLRGFVVGHNAAIDLGAAPTDLWPEYVSDDNIANFVINNSLLSEEEKIMLLQSFIPALAAATAGAVAIMPDYIGYGESKAYDRAFLHPLPYSQAAVVSYAAAKRYVSFISIECTQLVDEVTVTGYGEGGYFSTIGALALEQNGMTVLSVRPGATPFDLDVQLMYTIDKMQTTNTDAIPNGLKLFLAFFGYAYSNNFSFLSNANSGQDALDARWMGAFDMNNDLLDWYNAPGAIPAVEVLENLPQDPIEILNPNLLALYEESIFEGLTQACRQGVYVTESINVLCDAILDASLWNVLSSDVPFPVSICHSFQDDVISFENIPDPATLHPNVKFYSQNIGALNPRGSHQDSMFLCALDPILEIASTMGEPNSPVLIRPLENLPGQCGPSLKCADYYDICSNTMPCCSGFQCTSRFLNGDTTFLCTPERKKTMNKESIAAENVGGSDRGSIGT